MKVDQDIVQRIKVGGIFMLQVYKVMMGTMLSLFVPQACYEEVGTESDGRNSSYPSAFPDGHRSLQICSLSQNLENNEIYHRVTLYWNSLAFLSFLFCYVVELRRENWAIKFLDIDNDKPDNSLKEIIILEPDLDKRMDSLNRLYFRALSVTALIYFINVCLMINILKTEYHSMSTMSCFISFVMLVQMKLYNSLSVAHQSVKSDKMMSAFMSEFVSYNVLDPDYIVGKLLTEIRP
tara:strand:- start:116 stop:823 length:708 start_codon:yes stop_codon:yes gene_type:complete